MAAEVDAKEVKNATAEEEWDETRLQTAGERLQEIHIQLRRLRDAIPSLVRPIHAESSSPEKLYADFHQAAKGAVDNVKRFRALIRDSDNREVLAHVRTSKQQNHAGIENWLVEQHESWLDEPAVRTTRELILEDDIELPAPEREPEDVESIVKAFQERHDEVEIKHLPAISNILVKLPPPNLHFTISWSPNATKNRVYEVSTKGPTKLHSSINEFLGRRANKDDLNWTLELLSDYINIKQQRCQACNKLLDEENGFATVKVAKVSHDIDAADTMQWESFHVGCS